MPTGIVLSNPVGCSYAGRFCRDNKSRVIRFCSMRPSYFQDTLVSPFESQCVIAACVPSKYYITVIVFKCMVGNDGFEPSSTAPKAASLDQTSPTPHIGGPEGIRTPVCSLKRRALNLSEIQAQWPGERDLNPHAIRSLQFSRLPPYQTRLSPDGA